ncbi:MAG: dihydrofolate reductase [Bacteroidia bacterium]|nr:dihydrofolate reductase [Bacteroidia bacterium]
MSLEMIVATDRNGAIGKGNQLLWHLPADLKYFKNTTFGHMVLMGRKTFESIGKPLPGRENVVLTRSGFKAEGITVIQDVDAFFAQTKTEKKIFIIGGAEVYKLFIHRVQFVHQTWVDAVFPDADTFFPIMELKNNFILIRNLCQPKDDKNPYDYCFRLWQKK